MSLIEVALSEIRKNPSIVNDELFEAVYKVAFDYSLTHIESPAVRRAAKKTFGLIAKRPENVKRLEAILAKKAECFEVILAKKGATN